MSSNPATRYSHNHHRLWVSTQNTHMLSGKTQDKLPLICGGG